MLGGGLRGTDAGFEALYRVELVPLSAMAAALTGSRELGADLAHEALLRAYRDWSRVSTLERPGAWVRRVVINLANDSRRRRGREHRALGRLRTAPEPFEQSAADDGFWVAVRTLPDRQRAAVVLRYVADLPIDEIADVLDVTAGTVKASLFAARRSLAVTLGAEEEVEHADDR